MALVLAHETGHRMDLPLKVPWKLGGWRPAQTLLQCYQSADEDRLRKAIEEYREVGAGSN